MKIPLASQQPADGQRAHGRCLRTARRATAASLALLIALPIVLLSSGCGERPTAAVRFALAQPVQLLDPRFATDAASTRVARLLYARLVDFDERFEPVPDLATWERLAADRYRFTLRADRRPFHDGTEVRAEDVVATYRSVLDPATASPHRGSLNMLSAVRAVDDERIDFVLDRPDPLFPGRLGVGILPAELLQRGHDFGREPVGSGAFRFVDRPEAERVRIQRLEDGLTVEFQRVRRADVRVLKLLRGEVDLLQGDLPPELLGWLKRRPEVKVATTAGTTFAYVGFNLEDPVVGDPRVRRAIALAIDRERIIRHLWAGSARPAGGILTPDHWAGNAQASGPRHDPAQARALLAQAGYGPGRPVRIVYKTSTNPVRVRIASIIQDQLSRVGIEVDVRTYDWGTFYGDIKAGNFQMFSLAWVGIKMPDIFRYVFHSSAVPPNGANRGRYRDAEVDRLIDAAEGEPSRGRQAQLYRALQQRVLQTLPYLPLWFEDQVLVARGDILGYRLSADGNYDGLLTLRRAMPGRGS
jgi:peptide/nickel transport system substrate-binding protein